MFLFLPNHLHWKNHGCYFNVCNLFYFLSWAIENPSVTWMKNIKLLWQRFRKINKASNRILSHLKQMYRITELLITSKSFKKFLFQFSWTNFCGKKVGVGGGRQRAFDLDRPLWALSQIVPGTSIWLKHDTGCLGNWNKNISTEDIKGTRGHILESKTQLLTLQWDTSWESYAQHLQFQCWR